MYKRILVPTDGSERSIKAVEGAAKIANTIGEGQYDLRIVMPRSFSYLRLCPAHNV